MIIKDDEDFELKSLDVAPTVLRVSLYNFNDFNVRVTVTLKPTEEAEFGKLNVNLPTSGIKYSLDANKLKTICYFPKLHPEIPFGYYKAELSIDSKDMIPENSQVDQAVGDQGGYEAIP
jgi:hypothetical protein